MLLVDWCLPAIPDTSLGIPFSLSEEEKMKGKEGKEKILSFFINHLHIEFTRSLLWSSPYLLPVFFGSSGLIFEEEPKMVRSR